MKHKNKHKKKNKTKTDEPVKTKSGLSTLSIAVPGSILDNAQSPELRSYLAGQIARAACIYQVDEIIIYDDIGVKNASSNKGITEVQTAEGDVQTTRKCCSQFARILQYLECKNIIMHTLSVKIYLAKF